MYTSYCTKGNHFFLAEGWGETVCEGHKDDDSCGSVDLNREDESQVENSHVRARRKATTGTGAAAPVPRGASGLGEKEKAQPQGRVGQIQQLILGF